MGEDQINIFQKSLRGGFYETMSGKMETMAHGKKSVKAGKKIKLDPKVIYAHALALQHINTELDFEKLLVYKLAPYPTSMFN